MKKTFLVFEILFFVLILVRSGYAQPEAWSHGELQWFTIRSAHFDVHYHDSPYTALDVSRKGPERTAREAAAIAESIYETITHLYDHHPERIHIIIRDTDDYSNGGAYYYDNKIEIWASNLNFELRGTHHWLRNVITHEFTHMISIQAMMKLSRRFPGIYLQYIGYEKERRQDVLRGFPNRIVSYPVAGVMLPVWFAEGVAQYQQKDLDYEFWDAHRDMILRDRVLGEQMLTLNQMGTFGKNSIGNESAYNSGYALVSYIAAHYGDSSLKKITHYSSKLFYSFERAVKVATGDDIDTIYRQWKNLITEQYALHTTDIRAHARIGREIATEGTGNFYPALSPNGQYLAMISNRGFDYLSQASLYIVDPSNSNIIHEIKKAEGPLSWSPDSRYIAYAKNTDDNDYHSQYNDIYVYDMVRRKEFRITCGLRAFAPAFSPDGSSLAAIINGDGTNNIIRIVGFAEDVLNEKSTFSKNMFVRDGMHWRRITHFDDGRQIYGLCYTDNGRTLIFDTSTDDGRDIFSVDTSGNHWKPVRQTRKDERSPVVSQDGQTLYFSADETGIFNLYAMNLHSGDIRQITNVTGGAFYPAVGQNNILYYTLYQNTGFRVYSIADTTGFDSKQTAYGLENPNILSKPNDKPYPGKWPSEHRIFTVIPPRTDTAALYKNTFLKFSFLPVLRLDYGTFKPGVYFYSSDVLSKSSFFGGAMFNIPDMERDLFGIFEYSGFGPTLFLELYNITRSSEFRDDTNPGNDIPYESIQTNSFELREVDAGMDWSLFAPRDIRINYAHIESFVRIRNKEYDLDAENYLLTFSSGAIKYYYGNDFSTTWKFNNVPPAIDKEINPRGGRQMSVSVGYYMDNLLNGFAIEPSSGSNKTLYKRDAYLRNENTWTEFIRLPFGDHTLEARLHTGFIPTKVDSFYNFFGGSLVGLKGYSYYSIEGRYLGLFNAVYRFPLIRRIDKKAGPLYFDKIFGGLTFGMGNAWSTRSTMDRWKRDVGIELRAEMYSFYVYPTRLTFNAAYGIDRFTGYGPMITKYDSENGYYDERQKVKSGGSWRYYLTVLFGFTLFDEAPKMKNP